MGPKLTRTATSAPNTTGAKRKIPISDSSARKRARTYDARSLAVQGSDAALSKTGELDVSAFVAAREFEIRALEAGIRNSKAALASRAFQQVPRNLRRRTASHNVKRVPSRLRARARREVRNIYVYMCILLVGWFCVCLRGCLGVGVWAYFAGIYTYTDTFILEGGIR